MVESKFLPLTHIFASQTNALMVGKIHSLFPSTRSLIIKDSKRPHGQAVKTSPSHGGIWGSIPHGGTKKPAQIVQVLFVIYSNSFVYVCHLKRL